MLFACTLEGALWGIFGLGSEARVLASWAGYPLARAGWGWGAARLFSARLASGSQAAPADRTICPLGSGAQVSGGGAGNC